MYTPGKFKAEDREEVLAFIRANSFGILVNQSEGKLWATHIPLLLDTKGEKLSGHISKANKQWKAFSSGDEVMVIFQGPHAYISPSWYDHKNVPTWNYVAAHVYGTITIIEGEELYQELGKLVDNYEEGFEHPVDMAYIGEESVRKQMRGIVGFEIDITDIQASQKLSQNRNDASYQEVIRQLRSSDNQTDQKLAEEMHKKRPLD
ncbi:MAG: FMN-binding negative transcriptional regulator [Bacteroidota bacterium]